MGNYTGIKDLNNSPSISVLPNPTNGYLTVNFTQKAQMEILDINGQIIKSFNNEGKEMNIDLTNFPGGLYFLKATTEMELLSENSLSCKTFDPAFCARTCVL